MRRTLLMAWLPAALLAASAPNGLSGSADRAQGPGPANEASRSPEKPRADGDGTGAYQVADIYPGLKSSSPKAVGAAG